MILVGYTGVNCIYGVPTKITFMEYHLVRNIVLNILKKRRHSSLFLTSHFLILSHRPRFSGLVGARDCFSFFFVVFQTFSLIPTSTPLLSILASLL